MTEYILRDTDLDSVVMAPNEDVAERLSGDVYEVLGPADPPEKQKDGLLTEMAEEGGKYTLYDKERVEKMDSTTHWISLDSIINQEDAR